MLLYTLEVAPVILTGGQGKPLLNPHLSSSHSQSHIRNVHNAFINVYISIDLPDDAYIKLKTVYTIEERF